MRFQGDVEFVQTPRAAARRPRAGRAGRAGPRTGSADPCRTNHSKSQLIEELFDLPVARAVCAEIGLEGLRSDDETIILLSKYPGAPPLYWHQDLMNWGHPSAAAPWPTRIFLSYYTVDTDRQNGCLRAIPGSHRRRHRLHDLLPEAHSQQLAAAESQAALPAAVFEDVPDAVDLPMNAGDLIIGDARLLHSAWPNTSAGTRRTCILAWHNVFEDFPTPPSWCARLRASSAHWAAGRSLNAAAAAAVQVGR